MEMEMMDMDATMMTFVKQRNLFKSLKKMGKVRTIPVSKQLHREGDMCEWECEQSEDCWECVDDVWENTDWETWVDPCEDMWMDDMTEEDWDMLDDCYMANDPCGHVCDWQMCDDCWDNVEWPCEWECTPTQECDECIWNVDWENLEDPCQPMWDHDMEMTDEDWDMVNDCYMANDPCGDVCDWQMCDDCWEMEMEMMEMDMHKDDDMMDCDWDCCWECTPSHECEACYEGIDWENYEDPCEAMWMDDMSDEDWEALDECYMMSDPCMDVCNWDLCDECWENVEMPCEDECW